MGSEGPLLVKVPRADNSLGPHQLQLQVSIPLKQLQQQQQLSQPLPAMNTLDQQRLPPSNLQPPSSISASGDPTPTTPNVSSTPAHNVMSGSPHPMAPQGHMVPSHMEHRARPPMAHGEIGPMRVGMPNQHAMMMSPQSHGGMPPWPGMGGMGGMVSHQPVAHGVGWMGGMRQVQMAGGPQQHPATAHHGMHPHHMDHSMHPSMGEDMGMPNQHHQDMHPFMAESNQQRGPGGMIGEPGVIGNKPSVGMGPMLGNMNMGGPRFNMSNNPSGFSDNQMINPSVPMGRGNSQPMISPETNNFSLPSLGSFSSGNSALTNSNAACGEGSAPPPGGVTNSALPPQPPTLEMNSSSSGVGPVSSIPSVLSVDSKKTASPLGLQVSTSSGKPGLVPSVPEQKPSTSAENQKIQPDPSFRKVFTADHLVLALMPVFELVWIQDPESFPFRQPVDPKALGIPDYFDIIKNPIDLSTIRQKLEDGEYKSGWEFCNDMYLMFDNAWSYNRKTSRVYRYCTKLSEVFEASIDEAMQCLGYCCGHRYTYNPQVLYCYGKLLCKIPIHAPYFGFQKRYVYCVKCFGEIQGDTITVGDDPLTATIIPKNNFKEMKNNSVYREEMVECVHCGRKMHSVCVLHLDNIWSKGFQCDTCLKTLSSARKENKFTAKRLPTTKLATFLEDRVNNFIHSADVPEAGTVTIRVVSSSDKVLDTRMLMKERYSGEFPEQFPYRSKAIFVFEEIDGVDVCFFGMHVQEYGSDCQAPNTRRVYISYLDSVHFFRPRSLRTSVCHEILIGYLDFCKMNGFQTAHIWACPPSEGDDYIFHCHPDEQKIPKPKRLTDWYRKMLDRGKADNVVYDYRDIFKHCTEECITSVTDIPYFDGDFWPNVIEETIKELDQEAKQRGPSDNDTLLTKVYQTMEKHKDVFFTVLLNPPSSISSPLPGTTDPDNLIACDLMDGRDAFLTMARERYWEFSSLRRAKFSTMAMLYELHTQGDRFVYNCNNCRLAAETRYHCKECEDFDLCVACYAEVSHPHPMEKLDFGLELENPQSHDTASQKDPKEQRKASIEKCIRFLVHATQCHDVRCKQPSCIKMKRVLTHVRECKLMLTGKWNQCTVCKQFVLLCTSHAKTCKVDKCPVPVCARIKKNLCDLQNQRRVQANRFMEQRMAQMSSPYVKNVNVTSNLTASDTSDTSQDAVFAEEMCDTEFTQESLDFCASVAEHLRISGAINRFLAHLVFVGLPNSGKSTLIAHLLELEEVEEMLRASESTGLANDVITVNVMEDRACMHAANVDEKSCIWQRVEFDFSCLTQMGEKFFVPPEQDDAVANFGDVAYSEAVGPELMNSETTEEVSKRMNMHESSQIKSPEKKQVRSQSGKSDGDEAHTGELSNFESEVNSDAPTLSNFESDVNSRTSPLLKRGHLECERQSTVKSHQSKVDMMEIIQSLVQKKGFSAVRPFLENKSTLYLSDTGGQIEFQELLPLLVALHAIFVFLFPLNVDLNERVTVSYRKKVGDTTEHSNVYTSFLTVKESFLHTLASIDSMMESSFDFSIAKHKPYVFVAGTHKDCLVKELGEERAKRKIAAIDDKLKLIIQEHHYGDLVVYADKARNEVLFAVDNTSKNDPVFVKIRRKIVDLLHSGDEFSIQFPISYLLASLHLQGSDKPLVKRSEFAKAVHQYGIDEEDVDHLLQFLHTRIGQIRYFPVGDIKEIITREPQALYNLVTSLIAKTFISSCATMTEYSEVQRGIYSLNSFDAKEFSELLTPRQIITLLKELRIVAPFYDRKAEVEKYFIPFVLNHLKDPPDCLMSNDQSLAIMPNDPLAIIFECGHCPKGMFGVLLHYILTHDNKTQLEWNLDIERIFRDHVFFDVGPFEEMVSIKFNTTYLEVRYFYKSTQRCEAFSVKKICELICSTLKSGIEEAAKALNYSPQKTKHYFGAACTGCCKVHRVIKMETHYSINCPKQICCLPKPWFGTPPHYSFPELVVLKEGSNHQIPFNVSSDPPLEPFCKHVLSKEGSFPREDHVYLDYRMVCFKTVQKKDCGTYTISSSNAVGLGQASFTLRIKREHNYSRDSQITLYGAHHKYKTGPQYSLDTDYVEAEVGSSPTVTFTVTSDPPLAEDARHAFRKSDGSKVTKRFKMENNCITFRKVREGDSGVYTISCCNDEGEEGQVELELEVILPTNQPSSASSTGGTHTLNHCHYSVLMEQLSPCEARWEKIAIGLRFYDYEIEKIKANLMIMMSGPEGCLGKVISQWLSWDVGDARGSEGRATLETLRRAVKQAGCGTVANSLTISEP